MKPRKLRNIISLILFGISISCIVTLTVITISKINHNKFLLAERDKIRDEFFMQDDDIYDVFIYDNYTVYEEDTILEFSK